MENLFRNGIVPSKECMYAVARWRYLGFFKQYGRPPIPMPEKRLCQFVAFLAGEGLIHSSKGLSGGCETVACGGCTG